MPTAAEFIADGRSARAQQRLDDARRLYSEAARLFLAEKDSLAYAHTIRHIADIHLEESQFRSAKPLYEEALDLYRTILESPLLDHANKRNARPENNQNKPQTKQPPKLQDTNPLRIRRLRDGKPERS